MKKFDNTTCAQILHIQLNDIIKYCAEIIKKGYIMPEDSDKVQRMFKIKNEKSNESADLEQKAKDYESYFDVGDSTNLYTVKGDIADAFKAGAMWQKDLKNE